MFDAKEGISCKEIEIKQITNILKELRTIRMIKYIENKKDQENKL